MAAVRIACLAGLLCLGAAASGVETITLVNLAPGNGLLFKQINYATETKYPFETLGGAAAALDYDSDGLPDLLFLNGSPSPEHIKKDPACHNRLFRNLGGNRFADVTERSGLSGAGKKGYPQGVAAGDYDNDGDVDLCITSYGDNLLCRNNGDGTFSDVTAAAGVAMSTHPFKASACWLDYNNDGFLDLFVGTRGNPSGANFLYRNSGVAGGNTNHWLIVKPRGTTSNRSAIGAKLRVQATIRGTVTWQLREIQGNYFDDLRAHFGLGNAANATTLRIEWPSGTVQELTNIASDQILEVIEPRRPVLAFLDLSPSKVDGSLQADPGTSYVVEFSGDLASWTVLATVTTDASGEATWSDTSSPLATHRYYKASRSSP